MGMVLITLKVPVEYIAQIDTLVRSGRYTSRSEAIRAAIREFLQREFEKPPSEAEVRVVDNVKMIKLEV